MSPNLKQHKKNRFMIIYILETLSLPKKYYILEQIIIIIIIDFLLSKNEEIKRNDQWKAH